MAAPNIVNVGLINGKIFGNVLTTSNAIIIANGSSSGNVIKINSLIVSNITSSYNSNVTVEYNTAAAGSGTPYRVAAGITVPAAASLIVIDKSTSIYLEENTSLKGFASTAANLEFIVSYEIIN